MHNVRHCTTLEAAERLGVDRSTVRRLIESGHLVPLAKLPGRTGAYLLNPDEVEHIAKERTR